MKKKIGGYKLAFIEWVCGSRVTGDAVKGGRKPMRATAVSRWRAVGTVVSERSGAKDRLTDGRAGERRQRVILHTDHVGVSHALHRKHKRGTAGVCDVAVTTRHTSFHRADEIRDAKRLAVCATAATSFVRHVGINTTDT